VTVITLLTDYGSASPYPAELKAVLVARCRARIADITHDIAPHDVVTGAQVLAAAAPMFPAGAVHLAVVDPGVGTERRPLVVAAGGHRLVGPDNGLLMTAARVLGRPRAYLIDAGRFALQPFSATFHGRDLFAPAAAALATGLPPERIGPAAETPLELAVPPATRSAGVIRGRVLYCDTFGNTITNIPGEWLDALGADAVIEHRGGAVAGRRVRAYGEGRRGEALVLVGSAGTVEVAINAGRAAEALGLAAGDDVVFKAAAPAL
jgi:hypothetical protein